uniref:Uncharacterized protein n=1 Tax=Megaselia scalaris TaxID=36166 RepID=T1GZE9_MEGSC
MQRGLPSCLCEIPIKSDLLQRSAGCKNKILRFPKRTSKRIDDITTRDQMASKNLNGKRCQKNGASILLAVMYNNFPYIAIIQQIINRKLKLRQKRSKDFSNDSYKCIGNPKLDT